MFKTSPASMLRLRYVWIISQKVGRLIPKTLIRTLKLYVFNTVFQYSIIFTP